MGINSNMQISLKNTSTAYKDVNCRCAHGNHAKEDMLLYVDGRQQGKKGVNRWQEPIGKRFVDMYVL